MLRFELGVAITLAASTCCSLIVFYLTRDKEGKVQLPTHVNESSNVGHDPFDVTTPEDIIDGYPIDADAFWALMRQRKLVISLLLSAILVIDAILLGWFIAHDKAKEIGTYAVHIGFCLYTLGLALRSVNQNTSSLHSESILHLTALSSLASVSLSSIAILPDAPAILSLVETTPMLLYLWHTKLGLYMILCVLTITTRQGPRLRYPLDRIYAEKTRLAGTNTAEENVSGSVGDSPWGALLFSYTTKVVWLGNTAASLEVADLPIVPGDMRATYNHSQIQRAMREIQLQIGSWRPRTGSGWTLAYRILRLNWAIITVMMTLAAVSACLFYAPSLFLRQFVAYLEVDPDRKDTGWGWVYVAGIFVTNAATYLVTGQLWSLSTTTIQVRLRIQLNSILFAKTLVRKDVASSAATSSNKSIPEHGQTNGSVTGEVKADEDDFSSKAQIMTLMTTDVDRVSDLAWHLFALVDSPIEIVIGSIFLYSLLGISCFFGLAVTCLFLPLNHFAGKIVVGAQDNLMKARDERVALMNEILGGIRMLKFMAWERNFEKRVLVIREKELKYQKLNYTIEILWNAIWNGSPILVTLVSFWHFAVVRQQILTPSIAFTSIIGRFCFHAFITYTVDVCISNFFSSSVY